VGKSDMLEHKSGNIFETRKDRQKVTMECLWKVTNVLLNMPFSTPPWRSFS